MLDIKVFPGTSGKLVDFQCCNVNIRKNRRLFLPCSNCRMLCGVGSTAPPCSPIDWSHSALVDLQVGRRLRRCGAGWGISEPKYLMTQKQNDTSFFQMHILSIWFMIVSVCFSLRYMMIYVQYILYIYTYIMYIYIRIYNDLIHQSSGACSAWLVESNIRWLESQSQFCWFNQAKPH
jgi:hypothetical protein